MKLYEIANEFDSVLKALEFDGELTPELESDLTKIEFLIIEKTDSCLFVAQKFEDEIELAKAHIKRLQDFVKANERKLERYQDYVKSNMDRMGKSKIEGILGAISIRKPSQVLEVTDESLVPPQFKTVEVVTKIDKKAVKDAINNGEQVFGAHITEGKRSVSFKLKGVK